MREFRTRMRAAKQSGSAAPKFPEALIVPGLENTWHDTAEAVVGNWIGLIYQVTHSDRRKPFMDQIDARNPLSLDW